MRTLSCVLFSSPASNGHAETGLSLERVGLQRCTHTLLLGLNTGQSIKIFYISSVKQWLHNMFFFFFPHITVLCHGTFSQHTLPFQLSVKFVKHELPSSGSSGPVFSHALPCLFTIKQLAGGSNPWDLANTIVVDCVQ